MAKRGVTTHTELLPSSLQSNVQFPRYVRVNTLKASVADVVAAFVTEGYRFDPTPMTTSRLPQDSTFHVDAHLPHVLVFPTAVDLHAHPLLLNGTIILQDKAR